MKKTPATILRDAADYLAKHGKCEGAFLDPNTKAACAVGALRLAAWGSVFDYRDDENAVAYWVARQALSTAVGGVYTWSDTSDAATVIAAMRQQADTFDTIG